jgi:hypothetical protein
MGYLYEACDRPKRLWSFIKSKKCDSTGVAPLSKGGNNHSGSLEEANIICICICSRLGNGDGPIVGH